jgi:hypothetical protein
MQEELCEQTQWDFSNLKTLFINTTLKPSPDVSNTQGLIDISAEIMRRQGVSIDEFRAVDHDIAPGVWPDMSEHGQSSDEWPELFERVMNADASIQSVVRGPIESPWRPPNQRERTSRGSPCAGIFDFSPA